MRLLLLRRIRHLVDDRISPLISCNEIILVLYDAWVSYEDIVLLDLGINVRYYQGKADSIATAAREFGSWGSFTTFFTLPNSLFQKKA